MYRCASVSVYQCSSVTLSRPLSLSLVFSGDMRVTRLCSFIDTLYMYRLIMVLFLPAQEGDVYGDYEQLCQSNMPSSRVFILIQSTLWMKELSVFPRQSLWCPPA